MVKKYKYSKGRVIHKTKKSAMKVAMSCKAVNVPYKITRLKKGFRVDKDWR